MMCFLHFKLECFNICVTLVKYKRVCLHSENHTTNSLDFKVDIIVVLRMEDTE